MAGLSGDSVGGTVSLSLSGKMSISAMQEILNDMNTAQMRAFLERLAFPWLSYNDYSMTAPKKMPVILVETTNGKPMMNNSNGYGSMENCISNALGKPRHIKAYNTFQVKNYDRFELAAFSEPAKRKWREEHWEEDLQKAFDVDRKMAEGND